jgi:hypothetical protein
VTRSSARLRSKAQSPRRQAAAAATKEKTPRNANKPVSKDSEISQTSRTSRRSGREPVIEEEPTDVEDRSSRQESEAQEGTEREETPTQVKFEEAVEGQVEVASRDSTPPKRESKSFY